MSAPAEPLLAELTQLVELRYGARGSAAIYLLGELRTLFQQLAAPSTKSLAQIELHIDQIEDVLEALGVDAWT
jgi:hypothetical protein